MNRTCRRLALAAAVLLASPLAARADELLWARRNMIGGTSTVQVGPDGELSCTGCDVNAPGRRYPIRRAPGIALDQIRGMSPWMSSLWVVVFRVDGGNRCEGDFYSVSLNTHLLERVNKLGCASVNMTATEKGLGLVVTLTDDRGRKAVTEIR